MKIAWRIMLCCFGTVLSGGAGRADESSLTRIAFGSCFHQDRPAPIWEAVRAAEPDLWVWLGDIVYGDSDQASVLAGAYAKLSAHPGYAALKRDSRVVGTWDDHDFGKNNGGKEWRGKRVAQDALLNFLEEPQDSPRRAQEGVYASYDFGEGDRRVKVMLIDVRYHRDDPADPEGDLFGPEQREWIERELSENRAAITVIASGTQVLPEDHRYEKWAQFPQARRWFFERIVAHAVPNVVFLSGDRHIAEISRLELEGREEPLLEATSSSLTHSWTRFPGEPNRHRVGEVFAENNFGLLEIDWEQREAVLSIRDERGHSVLQQRIELQPAPVEIR